MKVNLEKIEKNLVALEIEVEAEKVEQAVNQAHNKLSKKVNVPGFRKGKAPRPVLERFIGKEALLEEAAEIMILPNYIAAIKETGIEPIDRPTVDIIQLDNAKPFSFKVTVEVKPEVTIGQYKDFQVEKKEYTVGEEDINKEIEKLQQRYAQIIELGEDEKISNGDIAEIAFEGFIDDKPFEGGTSDSYSLGIGSGSFIPGFEEQLIGAKIKEKRDIKVTFPENYYKEELAGKEALFKVEIKGVKRKELTAVDDEFAKDVSEFDTLDELKADIRKKLVELNNMLSQEDIKNQVISKVVEAASVEIPEVMINEKVDVMVQDFKQNVRQQGIDFNFKDAELDNLREQYRPQAESNVKTELVLATVAKIENISVTDEDINKEIDKIAQQYNQKSDLVKASLGSTGRLDLLKEGLLFNKTIDFLVDNSTIV